MPKASLSLKRVPQNGPPKNQKSITSFFKGAVDINTQTTKSPIKQESSKRKAFSPVLLDTIEIDDDTPSFTKNSLKKYKTNEQGVSLNRNKSILRSPNKENGHSIAKSPSKENHERKGTCMPKIVEKQINVRKEIFSGEEQNNDECPLELESDFDRPFTPETLENHEKDHQENACDKVLKSKLLVSPVKNHVRDKDQNHERNNSVCTKKGSIQGFHCSPIDLIRTPEKTLQKLLSPSKSGSTVKALDFDDDVGDLFGDEWDVGDIEENVIENLDMSVLQRCEVISVKHHGTNIELKLANDSGRGTCFIEGIWMDTPLVPGEIISVVASRDSGRYTVSNTDGLLVLRPDHLVSSTSVVGGVFCQRKAVLQERFKGIDPANHAMTIGILIHELVQKALTQRISSLARLRLGADLIIKESVQRLYDAGLSEEEARTNMQSYIGPLAEFMHNYVENDVKVQKDKNNWNGHVDKILDIEENLCCPQLGLKGKIDATLEVTIHGKKGSEKAVVPLELKSGRASVSAEHRGQLVLYGMMLSVHARAAPATADTAALLLYLRDRVDLREVSCGYPERRDLIMLRNQMAQYLAAAPQDMDYDQLVDIEDAAALLQQKLPAPVSHPTACSKCAYLTLCSIHLWHTEGPRVSHAHPLHSLRDPALGHLSPAHIEYFQQWAALLRLEERVHTTAAPLHALWTDPVEKRSERGTCAPNLKLNSVKPLHDRFLHVFQKNHTQNDVGVKSMGGPQEGDFCIVSVEGRPWIAAGVLTAVTQDHIQILLERDLSQRRHKGTVYHIDAYESYATTTSNLTNLGVLMEDTERAGRLRRLIIDRSPPQFSSKLPREVGRLGVTMMRSLNIQQQRAVFKAISAQDYALLKGLPGTGKTQTVSVLIQMLVALKQRVLVSAHTHSAVDTVLTRLPSSIKVMRLGASARVAPSLHARTEHALTAACDTPEQLARVYDSMEVVGVTCLGAAHALLSRTTFDVCIIDEATQVLQCTVLRPLFAAKKFVLVGDPEQLPPVVRSRPARRLGMEESLFHRLMRDEATSTLQLQYRMNKKLAAVANDVAYHGQLVCATPQVADGAVTFDTEKLHLLECEWLRTACNPALQYSALFIDTSVDCTDTDRKSKLTNDGEAVLVMALIEAFKTGGVQNTDIGVIAPYREQVSYLRRVLTAHSVEVSTVDQFQGRDKSLIIYSCTRRDHDDRKVKDGEVLNDQRRLAVSVTRAKHKFIVVGDSRALQKYVPLQRLLDACKKITLEQDVITNLRNKYKSVI